MPGQYSRVAAVTGANKGIGFAIVRNLALKYPTSPLNNGPLLIYLAARDSSRGKAAIEAIHADPELRRAEVLRRDGGLSDVKFALLDISSEASAGEFESFLKREHPEGIDILVNNAGVALDGFDSEIVRKTLACNYYGTLNLTQRLLPHIRKGGRIVNVSSMVGALNNKYPEHLIKAFRGAKTLPEVTTLMEDFQHSVDEGLHTQDGWPTSAYAVSKSGLTGATKILGKQILDDNRGVLLNCCCPGYIKTDLTKHNGRLSPDRGAETPVFLACGDINGVSGEFWKNEEVQQW